MSLRNMSSRLGEGFRGSITSIGSAMGLGPNDAEDVHIKKERIQEGLQKAFSAKDRFEKDGLVTTEAGENETLTIPEGCMDSIVEAKYGAFDEECGTWEDVLERVEPILGRKPLVVNNSKASMNCDPRPGVRKILRVLYKPKSDDTKMEFDEGASVTIVELESVVAAQYGAGNQWVNVLVQVQSALIEAEGKPIVVSNDLLGGDPWPGVPKKLVITVNPSRTRLAFKVHTSKELATFQVIAPWLFHKLCDTVGVAQQELFESMTSQPLKGGEKQESGKSGEVFWFTHDSRFVLKTISDGEIATLVKMLPEYTQYLGDHKDSLLTRYLGVFSLSDNGVKTQFVVMNNIFEGSPDLDIMYDLKGTTEDRWVDPAPGKCLKDNNFAEVTLFFEDETSREIHRVIAADTKFLEKQGIMDYSMMVAIAYSKEGTLNAPPRQRKYSKLIGGLAAHQADGVLSDSRRDGLVFIGMVDMLVTYGWKKVAAHVIKSNTIGWQNEIDTVAPERYATRFRCYFGKKLLGESEKIVVTEVSPDLFESPMPALGRSGGTAAFFKVTYKDGAPRPDGHGPLFWIGKDLARARDEVDFYEKAKSLQGTAGYEMLDWMTPYMGVCRAQAEVQENQPPSTVELMLLRNGRDGYKTCRMLDIKIGQVTAVAGWQNKSTLQAMLQVNTIDAHTNSDREGFRLEGFDSPPAAVLSVEDLLESSGAAGALNIKKVKRFNLQRLTAAEFVSHFLDLHDSSSSSYAKKHNSWRPPSPEGAALDPGMLSVVETQEIVLLNCIAQLSSFIKACRASPVPQQWIGSSVMLAFDAATRPAREVLRRGSPFDVARVHIFDWGRSELNTAALHERLEDSVKEERQRFWGYYCGGVARLLYTCVRLYLIRYWHEKQSVYCSVWDKDRITADDFIGRCTLKLEEQGGQHQLSDFAGSPVVSGMLRGTKAQLGVGMKKRDLPADSRLRDCWVVRLHDASNLPSQDFASDNDVFVEVQGLDVSPAAASDMTSVSKQLFAREGAHLTTVAVDCKSPVFEEEFEIATLTDSARSQLLQAVAIAMDMEGKADEEVAKEMRDYFPSQLRTAQDETVLASLQTRFSQKCFPGLIVK